MMLYDYTNGPRTTLRLDDFLRLSERISYQLQAKDLNEAALLQQILGHNHSVEMVEPLRRAIRFIVLGYGHERRKLGPLAVLHPLRTAAVLARTMARPGILDLVGALFHDRDEDLRSKEHAPAQRERLQLEQAALLQAIDSDQRWYLGERIALLTRLPEVSYFDYLKQLIQHAAAMPDLVRIKLADKLDSTFDIMLVQPSFSRHDFYQTVFEILFVPTYDGLPTRELLFLIGKQAATLLLSTLGKNAVLLSLIRRDGLHRDDPDTATLCQLLADASVRQAQWVLLELFASEILAPAEQRRLLKNVMEYSEQGGVTSITSSERGHVLDGTFLDSLAVTDEAVRKERLAVIYTDPDHLARVILALISAFSCFLKDEDFYIEGIDPDGISSS
jgi:hypothetical protein